MAELGTTTINGYTALHAGHDVLKRTKTFVLGGVGIYTGNKIAIPRVGMKCKLIEWYIESGGFVSGSVQLDLNKYSGFAGETLTKLEDIDLSSTARNSSTGLAYSLDEDDKLELEAKTDATTLTQVNVTLVFEIDLT